MKLDSVFNVIIKEDHLSPCALLVRWDEYMDELHNQGFRLSPTTSSIYILYIRPLQSSLKGSTPISISSPTTSSKSRPLYVNTYIKDIFIFKFLYIGVCYTLKCVCTYFSFTKTVV
jgi:hypothetical protein